MIGGGVDLGLRALSSQLDLLLRIGDNIGGGREEGDLPRRASPSVTIAHPAAYAAGGAVGDTSVSEAADAAPASGDVDADGGPTAAVAPVERDAAPPSRSLLGLRAPAETRRDTSDGKPAHLSPDRSLTRLAPERPGYGAPQIGVAQAGMTTDLTYNSPENVPETEFRSIVARLLTPAIPMPGGVGSGIGLGTMRPGDVETSTGDTTASEARTAKPGDPPATASSSADAEQRPRAPTPPPQAAALSSSRLAPQAPSQTSPRDGATTDRSAAQRAATSADASVTPVSETDSTPLALSVSPAAQRGAQSTRATAYGEVGAAAAAPLPGDDGGSGKPGSMHETAPTSARMAEPGSTTSNVLRAETVEAPPQVTVPPTTQPSPPVDDPTGFQAAPGGETAPQPIGSDRAGRTGENAADGTAAASAGGGARPSGDGRAGDAPTVLFDRVLDFGDLADAAFGFSTGPAAGSALDTQATSAGVGLAALAEAAAGGQPERAGVIASFILNAAMIPGWPPPRPIVGVALTEFRQQWSEAAKLSKGDLELLVYLANLGFGRKQLRGMLKRIEDRRRRSRILLAIAAFMTNLTALAKTYEDELARLASDAEDEARLRNRPGRDRLVLR